MAKICLLLVLLVAMISAFAQTAVDTRQFIPASNSTVSQAGQVVIITWPTGKSEKGILNINLEEGKALFGSIGLITGRKTIALMKDADPVFLLTVGKRDLISQNGWNIFFDKVPLKPHQTFVVKLEKRQALVRTEGSRTVVQINRLSAAGFSGLLEITLYHGSPLFNIAAVMSTAADSTAIVYDAGLTSYKKVWDTVSWANVYDKLQQVSSCTSDTSINQAVKYRAIVGSNTAGSLAIFPAPHQFFYPLDEAFNLRFTWYGNHYNKLLDAYGLGIRQDLYGDRRYVPWFNAPPNTAQRLNFFCFISKAAAADVLEKVKAFTHHDSYLPLPGYKTLASHFHNEHVMATVLAGKPVPDTPNFVKVFNATGINIVHLAEFHYTAHPKGPDQQRLIELKTLFSECRRLSTSKFLLLPGEEPNEFLGGHWLAFFPKPVYWIMARKPEQPFVTIDQFYGKVYRIGNAQEMQDLLQAEKGLAWTAHARTKGSTGFPDAYKTESFFLSDRFLGAAWKAMPADLSQPRLGSRVLDLMDDMNNWGLKKKVLAEADLFSIAPENEMYAHLNINYLKLSKLPRYSDGWQPVLDILEKGSFFSTTGEVLLPAFTINGKHAGETLQLSATGKALLTFDVSWTFPLQFAEIISGDGRRVYRDKINLLHTRAFGRQIMSKTIKLAGRKWARLEVWDVAANGAFTQTIWLQ